ncbi:hypothetical protein E9531_03830 [Lampropedia puyangensis]|uniref:DUF2946 domain-containing protein n=1 Tax=Lampropedia puyangensis TaxID=1330072 RepID=A0A4S8FB63_9BURK|nr:hypothetical protein [Lampropedia puyangensis]THU04527.1 hypothetical protein E9531_03830 [Lampropedia puyangensis]
MFLPRTQRRLIAFALIVAVLWAALHPAIINAAQPTTHRVLVCTPNGMEWVDTDQISIEAFLGLHKTQQTPKSDESSIAWMAPCPFNHATQVLPLHDGSTRLPDPLLKAYVAYQKPVPYISPIAGTDGYRLTPPTRAPPTV